MMNEERKTRMNNNNKKGEALLKSLVDKIRLKKIGKPWLDEIRNYVCYEQERNWAQKEVVIRRCWMKRK